MFANEIRGYDLTAPVFPMDIDSDGGFVNPELTQFRRLKEKATCGATQLKEIVAREGQGSFDWLDLAHRIRVHISLVDLWSICGKSALREHVCSGNSQPGRQLRQKPRWSHLDSEQPKDPVLFRQILWRLRQNPAHRDSGSLNRVVIA
ncbi:hypothetical protein V2G26_007115 [Clonostachys chloroleuca]